MVGRLRRRIIAANLAGGVVTFLALAFVGGRADVPSARLGELVVVFVGYALIVFPVLNLWIALVSRPAVRAVAEGLPLQGASRRWVLAGPWLNAGISMVGWFIAAVLFPLYSWWRLDNTAGESGILGGSIFLGGLTTMTLVYLLAERDQRPFLELAFRDQAPQRIGAVAVRPRLQLAWLLGAGAPLLFVALALLDPDADADQLRIVGLTFISLALVGGWLVSRYVARSVADPLTSVREAMGRVREGDLQVSVAVDDATEIGMRQSGFNTMVEGLRERERMRDLFGRHVGEAVVHQALERGVELGGEVRSASALFVDLTGSTELARSRPPAEVVGLLNQFFAAVVAAVEAEGGWVNKFEGDAALCVFGVPGHQPDHPAHALRAARELRRRLDAVRARHAELSAGIGVSSGDVLAGNVGAEQRYEYTVIGDPVNEAARLTDEAKGRRAGVLASRVAVEAAGSEAGHWRPAGEIVLRGRPGPTAVYEPSE